MYKQGRLHGNRAGDKSPQKGHFVLKKGTQWRIQQEPHTVPQHPTPLNGGLDPFLAFEVTSEFQANFVGFYANFV